jgi:hypothetical protein
MSSVTINPEQLEATIQGMLSQIPQKVDNIIEESAKKVSKEAVKQLRAKSPVGEGTPKSGRYAKGWAVKKQGKSTFIWNKTDYMLTHLLENGHDVIVHGKKVGHYDGKEHIADVERQVIEDMTEEVEKGIDKL